ncbi:hypothetical protein [Nostoc sp. C110]|uniref:hypothetical protein n=1 Tax=Nostoc sp. C110 TaxID=3349876 RepID=UPI00370D0D88
MKFFNDLPQECQQVLEISNRLPCSIYIQIRSLETVKSLLQSLGKVNRPYLTELEEKLLSLLESEVKL